VRPKNELPRLVPIPVVVLLSAWFVFVVVCFSDAGADFGPVVALVYGGMLWGVIWLVRLIVTIVRQQRGAIPRPTLRYALVHWGVEPVVLLFCGVLALTGGLYHVRFRLCRPSLDAYVADVVAGRVQPHGYDSPSRWVGLFHVAETELQTNGVVRIITTSTFLDDAGFAYSPVSPPPRIGEDSYDHITDSWYRWHRSW
jgi:hypothetical protein